jgi:hypothetical protein
LFVLELLACVKVADQYLEQIRKGATLTSSMADASSSGILTNQASLNIRDGHCGSTATHTSYGSKLTLPLASVKTIDLAWFGIAGTYSSGGGGGGCTGGGIPHHGQYGG